MKTPEEIRRRRDALRGCLAAPCGCAGGPHAAACAAGRRMLLAALAALSWALGDGPDVARLVEVLAADARKRSDPR